jgi:hypothetical protein
VTRCSILWLRCKRPGKSARACSARRARSAHAARKTHKPANAHLINSTLRRKKAVSASPFSRPCPSSAIHRLLALLLLGLVGHRLRCDKAHPWRYKRRLIGISPVSKLQGSLSCAASADRQRGMVLGMEGKVRCRSCLYCKTCLHSPCRDVPATNTERTWNANSPLRKA